MSAVILWGWDSANSEYVKVLIDAAGHLQVDTLSSALPTGAATLAKQTDQLTKLNSIITKLAGGLPAALDATSGLKVANLFGGAIYSKTLTMVDNNPTRFESTSKKLRDMIIIVKTNPMFFGKTSAVVYPVAVGETIGFTKVDISTLYFRNQIPDSNGVVRILGVEE